MVGAGGEPVSGYELLGSASAANYVPALENEDAEAGAGKVCGAGEAVVAPSDDYGVMGRSGHFFFLDLGPNGSGRKGPVTGLKEAFEPTGGLCVPESLSMATVGAVGHAGEGSVDLHRSAESHRLHAQPGDCLVDSYRGLRDQGYALGEGPGYGVQLSLGDYLCDYADAGGPPRRPCGHRSGPSGVPASSFERAANMNDVLEMCRTSGLAEDGVCRRQW